MREILNVRDSGQPPCEHVASLVEHRLTEIERRMLELRKLRSQLQGIAKRARTFDLEDCEGYCGLIA
ncbi:MAG: MerR family DNA-binding protein [Actinobacteria bacterium]|nr:MerR family DNA-binding protein [Actinomycetota bacterium]